MTLTITMSDFFCGAGGSSTGARKALEAGGGRVVLAANHWQRATILVEDAHGRRCIVLRRLLVKRKR